VDASKTYLHEAFHNNYFYNGSDLQTGVREDIFTGLEGLKISYEVHLIEIHYQGQIWG
jgi:hypothetical protein